MLEKELFLVKYNINNDKFQATGLEWEDLCKIHDDFVVYRDELEEPAILLFNTLMKCPNVHSVRYRIKSPEHLIEKIIRKKIEKPEVDITIENYKTDITDLIGLRALHLFKENWEGVNDFIRDKWNLKQDPDAYYRDGDDSVLIEFFKQKGCQIKIHKYGYRSVHYIIESQPAKNKYYAEVQVRTIFEEAWSEIDHTVRYPYDLDNQLLYQFLLILNRLAGSADEMGSYVMFLKNELTRRDVEFHGQIEEKSKIIQDLEDKIRKLNIDGEELNGLRDDLEKLKNQKQRSSIYDSKNYQGIGGLLNSSSDFFSSKEGYIKLAESAKTFRDLGLIGTFDGYRDISRPANVTSVLSGISAATQSVLRTTELPSTILGREQTAKDFLTTQYIPKAAFSTPIFPKEVSKAAIVAQTQTKGNGIDKTKGGLKKTSKSYIKGPDSEK